MIRGGLVQRDQGYGVYASSYDKQNRHGPGAGTHEERPYVAVAGRIKEDEYTDPIKPENITRTERSINYNDVFQRRPTDITKQLSDILARTVGKSNPPGGGLGGGSLGGPGGTALSGLGGGGATSTVARPGGAAGPGVLKEEDIPYGIARADKAVQLFSDPVVEEFRLPVGNYSIPPPHSNVMGNLTENAFQNAVISARRGDQIRQDPESENIGLPRGYLDVEGTLKTTKGHTLKEAFTRRTGADDPLHQDPEEAENIKLPRGYLDVKGTLKNLYQTVPAAEANAPMFTDPDHEDFKVTEEQLDNASNMITKAILNVFKKDPIIFNDDPRYKEKVAATMKIANEYQKLSDTERYIVAYEALHNYPLMEQLAQSIYLYDTYERGGLVYPNYSRELLDYLQDLVSKTMKNPITELTVDEDGFVVVGPWKRKSDETSDGPRKKKKPNGKTPPPPKKPSTRAPPPPPINTDVPRERGPQFAYRNKKKITKKIAIPMVREQRRKR